jgi:hypothetical protein
MIDDDGDSSFGNFANWEMDIADRWTRLGGDMHYSKKDDYVSEYYSAKGFSRGRYRDEHTLWNPSGTRCGDKPACYLGTDIPNSQKTPDQTPQVNDISADEWLPWVMFNPYNPANVKNNGGGDYGGNLCMPDWNNTGDNPSLNVYGKNMCPMRAKVTGGTSSFTGVVAILPLSEGTCPTCNLCPHRTHVFTIYIQGRIISCVIPIRHT